MESKARMRNRKCGCGSESADAEVEARMRKRKRGCGSESADAEAKARKRKRGCGSESADVEAARDTEIHRFHIPASNFCQRYHGAGEMGYFELPKDPMMIGM